MTQLANLENYDVAGGPAFEAAYAEHLPDIVAVAKDDLIPVTVDVRKLIGNIMGSLPRILHLAPELLRLAEVGKFDQAALDNLQGYLFALAHAHALHLVATDESTLPEHAEFALQVREVLLADARALAKRGLISSKALDELRGGRGYYDVVFDLLSIVAALKAAWGRIQGKTALSVVELDRAQVLAHQLLAALGAREQGAPNPADAGLIRQKAFTLFVKTYDEVRRGVHFERWHEGDADEIAPSVYAGRRRRSRTQSVAVTGTDVPTGEDVEDVIDLSHLPTDDLLPDPNSGQGN